MAWLDGVASNLGVNAYVGFGFVECRVVDPVEYAVGIDRSAEVVGDTGEEFLGLSVVFPDELEFGRVLLDGGVAEDQADLGVVFEEVFLEEGDDAFAEDGGETFEGRMRGEVSEEVRVADGVFAVEEEFDAVVDGLEHLFQVDSVGFQVGKQVRFRHHFDEVEAAAQGGVKQGDGAVGGVHGAQDVDVGRHAEFVAGVRKDGFCGFRGTQAFGWLNQGDQFAENLGNVAAVDFVDDKDKGEFGDHGRLCMGCCHVRSQLGVECKKVGIMGASGILAQKVVDFFWPGEGSSGSNDGHQLGAREDDHAPARVVGKSNADVGFVRAFDEECCSGQCLEASPGFRGILRKFLVQKVGDAFFRLLAGGKFFSAFPGRFPVFCCPGTEFAENAFFDLVLDVAGFGLLQQVGIGADALDEVFVTV